MMALKGVNVVELVGLAPAPFCGLILSDFGANVIRVDRVKRGSEAAEPLLRGKKSISLDLKQEDAKSIFKSLCNRADVLIEPFRPGVMESLGLGPQILTAENKRLIYARLSGFGQSGPLSKRAGHDINYVSCTGVLSALGTVDKPIPPANLRADYAGGGLTGAFGILAALFEREKSGLGQVIDANLLEGTAYVSTALFATRDPNRILSSILWPNRDSRSSNLLDGGAPYYQTYRTKDNKFLAVGSLEPQFYDRLLQGLGLDADEYPQSDVSLWPKQHDDFAKIFLTKTQDEWMSIFAPLDCCVTPVVDIESASEFEHNKERKNFLPNKWPRPAPYLERTPANPNLTEPEFSQHTTEILRELGYSDDKIKELAAKGTIALHRNEKGKL